MDIINMLIYIICHYKLFFNRIKWLHKIEKNKKMFLENKKDNIFHIK